MHGALLRTGKSDEFIAVGETGQPVYKAALQLIAALTRKSPSLVNFLAVPKSNEQGSVIDWYSPIQGDVVPWSSATEAERDVARTQLNHFKTAIAEMSASLVQAGSKGGQSDQIIFGKLLGLVPHAPADSYVYLVEATRTNAEGAVERYSQPILTFWGFVQNEGDRHRDPLYFLTPRAATPAPSPLPTTPVPEAPAVLPFVTEPARPWWRRFWWLLPLLLILALLLFGLLRGCLPTATLPVVDVTLPTVPVSTESIQLKDPAIESSVVSAAPLPSIANVSTGEPSSGAPVEAPAAAPMPEPEPQVSEPAPAEQPEKQVPPQPPAPSAEPAQASAPGAPLSIPPGAAEGPAEFLNGNYRAGAGIMDAKTSRPLRLEYAFEKGQGKVTIRRPDGVSCSGAINAAMNGGNLALNSQAQADCTDGSGYDMPQVSCKPGSQSIADCNGNYGNTQFPMSMRRE
ncbi:SrfA family protein [Pseudomonas syringae group genomosp. 3]|uniref:SrfA family protein n=2 Tax=Pseudomonas syringae group genomosp. 3 TaxID=251701 RepID=UPI00141A618D|nr:SrfA family protein [Pseudomonas syringae group genomosp. 3]